MYSEMVHLIWICYYVDEILWALRQFATRSPWCVHVRRIYRVCYIVRWSYVFLIISGKGDVTLTMDDENLFKLMMGQLNPQQVPSSILVGINVWKLCNVNNSKASKQDLFPGLGVNVADVLVSGVFPGQVKNRWQHGTCHETEGPAAQGRNAETLKTCNGTRNSWLTSQINRRLISLGL